MRNKMAKNRIAVRGGVINSCLKLSFLQKNNKKYKKISSGFSIAEAMIAFTIVSVVIASAAPMISKQMLHNDRSDVQASILNQKIERLMSGKWTVTSDGNSVYRPSGNVGIGISDIGAKLHIKGSGADILKVQNSSGNDVLKVGNDNVISAGKTKISDGNVTIKDAKNEDAVMLNSNGHIILRPKTVNAGFLVKNINNDSSYIQYTGNKVYQENAFAVSSNGALRMNYVETKTSDIDNTSSTGPIGIYVDGKQRFWINETGAVTISYATDETRTPSYYPFQVRIGKQNNGYDSDYKIKFGIDKDGITKIYGGLAVTKSDISVTGNITASGNITAGGIISNVDLDTKFAKINNELKNTKELVAVLKEQNELLSEKRAILETTLAQNQAQNVVAKVGAKGFLNLFK